MKTPRRPKTSKQPRKSESAALILAGGESRRLFPFSLPKPLMRVGDESLLEQCLNRASDLDKRYIVTNAKVAKEIVSEMKSKSVPRFEFIIEPEARDTAAAVGFAIRRLSKSIDFVGILSADQYMTRQDSKNFAKRLNKVQKEVGRFPESLFVMGSPSRTKPKTSHTSFGWIVPESVIRSEGSVPVKRFVEKPSSAKLRSLLKESALINCGMFFGRRETFREAYDQHYPYVKGKMSAKDYSRLPKQPIDRAIFEKFESVRVLKLFEQWEDLGTWSSLDSVGEGHDFEASSLRLNPKKLKSNFVWSDEIEVHLFDVENLAVVQSGSKLLVMPKSKTSELKKYLDQTQKIKKARK